MPDVLQAKGSRRLRRLAPELDWPANLWMGVNVENNAVLHQVDDLRTVPASVRFLSCEPHAAGGRPAGHTVTRPATPAGADGEPASNLAEIR